MRALLFAAVLAAASCSKRPCEPWVSNGLSDLADSPGQRIEHCDPSLLRWRVIPGGTVDAFLAQSAKFPDYNGWRFWNRTAWVRPGKPAVRMNARLDGEDLVAEIWEDPSIDVAAALKSFSAPDGGS